MNKETREMGSEGGGGPSTSEAPDDGDAGPDPIAGRIPIPKRRLTGMERVMDRTLLELGLIDGPLQPPRRPAVLRRAGDAGLQLAMDEQVAPPPEQRPQA